MNNPETLIPKSIPIIDKIEVLAFQNNFPSEWVCTARNPDGSCVPGSEVWVDDPTPTTQPSNGGGGNNGGGNSGGGNNNGGGGNNGGSGNTPPVTTLPYEQRDDDQDSLKNGVDNCPTVANEDQRDMDQDGKGDLCDDNADGDAYIPAPANTDQFTQDYLDTSVGLGQAGVDIAEQQGINVDESTDAGKVNAQIARSVAPEDWATVTSNFNAYGIVVMDTTTTTSTTTSSTTTSTTSTSIAPETTVQSGSTPEETAVALVEDSSQSDGMSTGEAIGIGSAGLATAGIIVAIVALARRRKNSGLREKTTSKHVYIPSSPVAGH